MVPLFVLSYCFSFQLGVVLAALKNNGLEQNTTVIVWGDHGWQLGEHGEWAKFTNFEIANRVPLMIRAPSIPSSAGKVVNRVVELVDVYPTVVELTNRQVLTSDGLQGVSLVNLLRNTWSTDTPGVAYSQFTRSLVNGIPTVMGYTVRTSDYRYTEWLPYNATTGTANWESPIGIELYDHRTDNGTSMEAFENANLAQQPAYHSVIVGLKSILRKIVNKTSSIYSSATPGPSPATHASPTKSSSSAGASSQTASSSAATPSSSLGTGTPASSLASSTSGKSKGSGAQATTRSQCTVILLSLLCICKLIL